MVYNALEQLHQKLFIYFLYTEAHYLLTVVQEIDSRVICSRFDIGILEETKMTQTHLLFTKIDLVTKYVIHIIADLWDKKV